jgi:DNA repair exonuclease SbcCD ATPase subunit
LRLPVHKEALGDELPYVAPASHLAVKAAPKADHARARDLWDELRDDVMKRLKVRTERLRDELDKALGAGRAAAIAEADAALTARISEVKESMKRASIKEIEKERAVLEKRAQQFQLFAADQREIERQLMNLEEELQRRLHRAGDLVKLLEREKKRIVGELVPARHKVGAGGIQLFPLTVEIRLPEVH